jgi:hypothetical protein
MFGGGYGLLGVGYVMIVSYGYFTPDGVRGTTVYVSVGEQIIKEQDNDCQEGNVIDFGWVGHPRI